MMGEPVLVDELVCVAAVPMRPPTTFHALAIHAKSGKLAWSTALGSAAGDPFGSVGGELVRPQLLHHDHKLYVDTQLGALFELQVDTGVVHWAFQYESDLAVNRPSVGEGRLPSAPIFADGLLYLKGMSSGRLYAIDPSRPAVAWQRPVSPSLMLAGVDETSAYLAGQEVTAIELATRKTRWAQSVPINAPIRPLVTRDRLYQFSPGGVYELDRVTGEILGVFRGADVDSAGGAVFLADSTLITVSNQAITAYPLADSARAEAGTDEPMARSK
jgi:outer membrane protein assembly factor BamB